MGRETDLCWGGSFGNEENTTERQMKRAGEGGSEKRQLSLGRAIVMAHMKNKTKKSFAEFPQLTAEENGNVKIDDKQTKTNKQLHRSVWVGVLLRNTTYLCRIDQTRFFFFFFVVGHRY